MFGKLDVVVLCGLHVAIETKIDYKSLIDLVGYSTVAESVAVDLRVPWVLFGQRRVDLDSSLAITRYFTIGDDAPAGQGH